MPQADDSLLPNATPAPAAPADPSAAAAAAAGVNNDETTQQPKSEHELEIERLRKENAKLVRRIDRRTHAVGALSRELAMARAQSGQPAREVAIEPDDEDDDATPAPRRAQPAADADPEDRARQLAAEMRRAERIGEAARKANENGTKLDKEFRTLVSDLAQDLPLVDRRGVPTEFAEVVLTECDNPAAVLLHLAKNDDVAQSLVGLSGAALGRRLARIEADAAKVATDKPSNAPRPLEPLRPGSAADNLPSDKDSPEEWRRKEVARLNAKRAPQSLAAASR